MTAFEGEAGDVPPTGGFEDVKQDRRKRGPGRRDEDVINQGWEFWAATFALHRGRLTLLVSILTFLFTSLGFRVLGPSQEIKALDQKFMARDSVMALRVTRLEDRQELITDRLVSIEETVRFIAFLQCTQLRSSNPNLALDGCPSTRPRGVP